MQQQQNRRYDSNRYFRECLPIKMTVVFLQKRVKTDIVNVPRTAIIIVLNRQHSGIIIPDNGGCPNLRNIVIDCRHIKHLRVIGLGNNLRFQFTNKQRDKDWLLSSNLHRPPEPRSEEIYVQRGLHR